jgi:hypothetical protein
MVLAGAGLGVGVGLGVGEGVGAGVGAAAARKESVSAVSRRPSALVARTLSSYLVPTTDAEAPRLTRPVAASKASCPGMPPIGASTVAGPNGRLTSAMMVPWAALARKALADARSDAPADPTVALESTLLIG